MKRILLAILALVVVVVVLFVVFVGSAFIGKGQVRDGQQLGAVRIVKDGFTSVGVVDESDGKVALIDAGNDPTGSAILAELDRRKVTRDDVTAIFLTHGHPDHLGGAAIFPHAVIYALEAEIPLAEGKVSGKGPLTRFFSPKLTHLTIKGLHDGEVVEVGTQKVEAFACPGHTGGSTAYLVDGSLFLGDAAVADNKGVVHGPIWAFSDDATQGASSLKALAKRLEGKDVKTLVFAHYGTLPGLKPLADFGATVSGS